MEFRFYSGPAAALIPYRAKKIPGCDIPNGMAVDHLCKECFNVKRLGYEIDHTGFEYDNQEKIISFVIADRKPIPFDAICNSLQDVCRNCKWHKGR